MENKKNVFIWQGLSAFRAAVLCLLVVVLGAVGCAGSNRSRSDLFVDHFESLVVSNTFTLEKAYSPHRKNGQIQFEYDFLVLNSSSNQTVQIEINQSLVEVRGRSLPVRCNPHHITEFKENRYALKPNEQARIDCVINFPEEASAETKVKDTIAHLQIPFESGKSKSHIRLKYYLRSEDLQK